MEGIVNIPNIEDFGGGVGVADNAAAFNAAVLAGDAFRFRDTVMSNGGTAEYRFATEPAPINKPFAIYGALPQVPGLTWIKRDYQPSDITRGLFHFTGVQGYAMDMFIHATAGSGGTAITIRPTTVGAQYSINNCRITTGGGTWQHDILADGGQITNPQGVRGLTIDNCMLFGTNDATVKIFNGVHYNMINSSINQAGGIRADLQIDSIPGYPSTTGTIRLDYMTGNVILDHVQDTIIDVAMVGGSVMNTGNSSGIRGRGHVYGSIQNNWSNSSWA